MSTESRSILSALVVIAIIVGGVYWWKSRTPEAGKNVTRDNVEVTNLSAATGSDRVPSGFPAGLPLETENVAESFSQNYVERGVALSNYTYITEKSREEVLQSYKDYFSANEFIVGGESELNGVISLRARRGPDDILVIVKERDGEVHVQISYTDR